MWPPQEAVSKEKEVAKEKAKQHALRASARGFVRADASHQSPGLVYASASQGGATAGMSSTAGTMVTTTPTGDADGMLSPSNEARFSARRDHASR